ncbi:MAG: hypothetical protein P4L16_06670 [Chlamydiales bacterium]|nr:hypothetical protein [Chlamydiales bacterium]
MTYLEIAQIHTHEHSGFTIDGKPFFPSICNENALPTNKHNSIIIELDASIKSSLKWEEAEKKAEEAIHRGLYLLWYVNLGIASKSTFLLTDPLQYHSLQIALDHFSETLLKKYARYTLGVILFKGGLELFFDEESESYQEWLQDHNVEKNCLILYARDLLLDFLLMLAATLPAEVALFLFFDLSCYKNISEKLCLLSKSELGKFHLAIKEGVRGFPALCWKEEGTVFEAFEMKQAMLLPSDCYSLIPYQKIETWLLYDTIPLLFEDALNMHWDGLERLIVDEEVISKRGKRMLQGFIASGGEIIKR